MDSTLNLLGEVFTAEPKEDASGRVSDRLMTELSAHRTLALREALANDPEGLMVSSNRGTLCKALLSGRGRTCAGFRVVFAVGTGPLHDGSSRGEDLPRWTTHSAGLSRAHHQAG